MTDGHQRQQRARYQRRWREQHYEQKVPVLIEPDERAQELRRRNAERVERVGLFGSKL